MREFFYASIKLVLFCFVFNFLSIFPWLILWPEHFKANTRNKKCREAECNTIFGRSFSQKSTWTLLRHGTQSVGYPTLSLRQTQWTVAGCCDWQAPVPFWGVGLQKWEGRWSPSGVKILSFRKVKQRMWSEIFLKAIQKTFPSGGKGMGRWKGIYSTTAYTSNLFSFIVP